MKTLLVALMLTLILPSQSVAQEPSGRIAYDYCSTLPSDDGYQFWCDVWVSDLRRSGMQVGSGVDPALSPDGTRVAFVPNTDTYVFAPAGIAVVNLEGGTRFTLTDDGWAPAWSADGRRIAFGSSRSGRFELYVIAADGTDLMQVTTDGHFAGYPSWSPDGRIVFDCVVEAGNRDLCSVYADGTAYTRLTSVPGYDAEPAFSPDGTRIAFVTDHFGQPEITIQNVDGTVSRVAQTTYGGAPAWSPDGTQLAFSLESSGGYACEADGRKCSFVYVYAVNLDGTGMTLLAEGTHPSWALSPGGFPPAASFTVACTLLTCTFDASLSSDDGTIVSYAWRFGDGASGTGSAPVHTYATPGTYVVELTVVDDSDALGTIAVSFDVTDSRPVASFTARCSGRTCTFDASHSSDSDGAIGTYAWSFGDGTAGAGVVVSHTYAPGTYGVSVTVVDNAGASDVESAEIVIVNTPPTASFEYSCDALTCTFNGSRSSDSDGLIIKHAWNFGDAAQSLGSQVSHTYGAAGTYTVVLTVTDNSGGTGTFAASVSIVRPAVHIGDLDGTRYVRARSWNAFVTLTVHDALHRTVGNAAVSGVWSTGGSSSCTTDAVATCSLATYGIPRSEGSTTFTVREVTAGAAVYQGAANHDVDGDTTGTSITIKRR